MCRVQSPGEINVMIVPHSHTAGVIIPSAILKTVFRHILFYFCFFSAVWALTSGGFRNVSETLVHHKMIESTEQNEQQKSTQKRKKKITRMAIHCKLYDAS